MIIIIYAEKCIWQNVLSIPNKNFLKLERERKFINLIKNIYQKLRVTIILNEEKQNAFLLKSWTRQWCLLPLFLFNIVLKNPASEIRHKRNKYPYWKGGKMNLFFFTHRRHDYVYQKFYRTYPLCQNASIINKLISKVPGFKMNMKNQLHF